MRTCFDSSWLVDLMLRLAPELQDVPLYLKKCSELPAYFQNGAFGYTAPDTDLAILGHVHHIGRGIGIVIDDLEIRRCMPERHWQGKFIGTGVHELAHRLPVKLQGLCKPNNAPQQSAAKATVQPTGALSAVQASMQRITLPSNSVGIEFAQHDRWFFRAAAHLLFRSWREGVSLAVPLVDHRLDLFLPELEREVIAMRHASFEEIRSTRVPDGYRRAWRSHCVAWICEHRAQAFEADPTLLDVLEELTTR